MKLKKCSKCEIELTLDKFRTIPQTSKNDGLRNSCIKCDYAYNKKHRNEHREAILLHEREAKRKRYKDDSVYRDKCKLACKIFKENNKEKFLVYKLKNKERESIRNKKYRENNIEKVRATTIKWQINNKDKIKIYYNNHKENYVIYTQNRNAKIKKLGNNLSKEQWDKIKNDFDNKCAYCGNENRLTVEHFIPVTENGELSVNNIIPVCQSCNSSKCNTNFFIWYPKYKFYSKKREKNILRFLGYNHGEQQLKII